MQARIFAGSGGLGREWVRRLPCSPKPLARLSAKRIVVICGSRHPVSREQARRAEANGHLVIASPDYDTFGASKHVARESAQRLDGIDAVFVFGGDTAYALLKELKLTELIPVREIVPGVPVSRAGRLLFITKAGGFGSPDIVEEVFTLLS
jgi:uncharacterized protein YgbK (DUF1537 family)